MKIKALSLLELLLAIAVGAAIMIAAVRYYSSVSENQKLTALENQVTTIYKAVTACVAAQSPSVTKGGGDITTNCMNSAPSATAAVITNGYLSFDVFTNPWGGTNQLSVINCSATLYPTGCFAVYANAIPSEMCDRLNTRMKDSFPGNFSAVMANNSCQILFPL